MQKPHHLLGLKKDVMIGFTICAFIFVSGCGEAPEAADDVEKQAEEIRENIRTELKGCPNHRWAGEYYYGDGLGTNVHLMLAYRYGYLFEWYGCMGLYDRNFGAVSETAGKIRLSFTFENKRDFYRGIAEEFIIISWGERKYLIPTDDIIGFCNDINSGLEPRKQISGSNYLLKMGDEEKEVSGFPYIPKEYKEYLLERPIEAEIVDVGSYTLRPFVGKMNFKDIAVTVNAGKNDGLLPGMELHVIKPDKIFETVKITKVDHEKSEGVMTQRDERKGNPLVGWNLSTRLRWKTKKNK